jgi:hypothetical protein
MAMLQQQWTLILTGENITNIAAGLLTNEQYKQETKQNKLNSRGLYLRGSVTERHNS